MQGSIPVTSWSVIHFLFLHQVCFVLVPPKPLNLQKDRAIKPEVCSVKNVPVVVRTNNKSVYDALRYVLYVLLNAKDKLQCMVARVHSFSIKSL
jgi:hypothetical protein